jgi:methyltransferase (TIGR00027 family)
MATAVFRDEHRTYDARPWILDDPYALVLVGPSWREIRAVHTAAHGEQARAERRASVVVRSRYAEDRLEAGRHRQYVILGAGLDSFAWRRPDLLGTISVFEVDHPATQAWKRARAAELGLPLHDRHIFAPVDFESETLRAGLRRAGLDWGEPTFFSWLGVVPYLTPETIDATLSTVASCKAGSEIALSYVPSDPYQDTVGREILEVFSKTAVKAGEPITTMFSPTDVEAFVERCGLEAGDHPARDDLCDRYFSGRDDGLRSYTTERLMAARVTGA